MNYILDATVLLYNPNALYEFEDCKVIIPIEVIEKIDQFKREMSELGRNSRSVAKALDMFRSQGSLGKGVKLQNGSLLRVVCEDFVNGDGLPKVALGNSVDRRVLATALAILKRSGHENTVIISKDVNLRLRADALGILARDYETSHFPEIDQFTGWSRVIAPGEVIEDLRRGLPVTVDGLKGLPNEFFMLQEDENGKNAEPGRMEGENGRIVPICKVDHAQGAAGIRPLNVEQIFAFSALLDDNIKLVTLTGMAGTGKTLLAIAAGLYKVFGEDKLNRVLVFRPTMPVGRDIGFLPGDVQEKMRPWMQPIYDALELIREEDLRSPKRILPPDIMDCDEISIEPLTFIRGRSIPRQFIIIDEAQNLTPLEVKTVATRVGKGTKIILTGDPHQIDNPYVEALSNGLTYLVEKFRFSPLAAHISLLKGERSELAETAATLL